MCDNIKMDLKQDGMYWIDLDHDRDQWRALIYTVNNTGSIKRWDIFNSCATGDFSRRLSSVELVIITTAHH
jgi:hypothetical protein